VTINEESRKPVDLESAHADDEREKLLQDAQVDKVVRGVNGSISPKVRRLRPLAGIIIIAIVVVAALYMRHGLSVRHRKEDAVKVGTGPATTVEKGLLGQTVGQQLGQLGEEVTRRKLNVQPTIKVRPGYRFFVRVEKDILFSGPYSPILPAQ
jgi:Bacterial conjugation TrbI-like protein